MKVVSAICLAVFMALAPVAVRDDVGTVQDPRFLGRYLPDLVQAYVALGEAEMGVRIGDPRSWGLF